MSTNLLRISQWEVPIMRRCMQYTRLFLLAASTEVVQFPQPLMHCAVLFIYNNGSCYNDDGGDNKDNDDEWYAWM